MGFITKKVTRILRGSVRIVENPEKYESLNPSNKGYHQHIRECALL